MSRRTHGLGAALSPLVDPGTYRALVFILAALPVGVAGMALLIVGWTLAVALAITPALVPILIGFRAAVGLLARADAALARELLDAEVNLSEVRMSAPGRGFWRRGLGVLSDGAFWRQQAYLALRIVPGWAFAILELSLIATALGAIAAPFYYTSPRALPLVLGGLLLLVAAAHLVRPLAASTRSAVTALLSGDATSESTQPAMSRPSPSRALAGVVALYGALNALLIVIWALTGAGYFWPVWPVLGLGLPLAIRAWVVLLGERPRLWRARAMTRGLATHLGVSASLVMFLVAVWAITSRGYFWPVWPFLALGLLAAIHAAMVLARPPDTHALVERVGVLESTRAGAVDVQEAELRRIERDLHDGAQARLVALGMSLGMAEQRLSADPEGARGLVAEARLGVGEALKELRDLARGIHPPVLTDRGLGAALAALADNSQLRVTTSVDVRKRPAPAVESAAYFVVAEALTNATKHADAEHVEILIRSSDGRLVVQIVDDGHGGPDPAGAGLSGLRRRVQALDGTLRVASPSGGPTTLRAELPCAS